MPCEHYKDALIEVVATGAAPQGGLRAHLDECASCRAAFDEEQSLFAAIDSGLHAEANAEVPPSLIPRVRTRLDESAIARPRRSSSWFALAGAAVAAAFFLAVTTRHDNARPSPTNLAVNRTPAPQIIPVQQGASPSALPKKGNSGPRPLASTARNSVQLAELASHKLMPEILVQRDQEILLASYAQQWGSRGRAPLVASEVVDAKLELLKVQPIQITNLDVKPLSEEGSQ